MNNICNETNEWDLFVPSYVLSLSLMNKMNSKGQLSLQDKQNHSQKSIHKIPVRLGLATQLLQIITPTT